jgi:hypothetical protein
MIKDLEYMKSKLTLFTRPRRFGKTLNLSMLKNFYEIPIDKNKDKKHLFKDLKIWQADGNYMEKQGKYPVISLSLKSVDALNYDSALAAFRDLLSEDCENYSYLFESKKLTNYQRNYIDIMANAKGTVENCKSYLKTMSRMLKRYYGQNVIILIDEYDVPLQKAYTNKYYDEMLDLIRGFLHNGLKSNDSLARGILTGCLRVSQESIFTGLNNLEIDTILSPHTYEHFGFTQKEVSDMLKFYDLEDKEDEVKKWYDGYHFGTKMAGDKNIYNPWSIIQYMSEHVVDHSAVPKAYWVDTSSNYEAHEIIKKMAVSQDKEDIETLIDGGTIEKELVENLTYRDVDKSANNLWSLLLYTGYLTVDSTHMSSRKTICNLKIPNEELLYVFESSIRDWFKEQIKSKKLSKLCKAIINKDTETMKDNINELLLDSISYNDYKESFYHGLMLGILAHIDGYAIQSNKENGLGRSDIVVTNKAQTKAIIFEFKYSKIVDAKAMDKKCDEALKQIEEKKYAQKFLTQGYKDITKYAITFAKKRCRVKTG